jgi:hypothetical protein
VVKGEAAQQVIIVTCEGRKEDGPHEGSGKRRREHLYKLSVSDHSRSIPGAGGPRLCRLLYH